MPNTDDCLCVLCGLCHKWEVICGLIGTFWIKYSFNGASLYTFATIVENNQLFIYSWKGYFYLNVSIQGLSKVY